MQCSNENLQQFAYIASHDLQEPLRKIQQFGDLLKTQYAPASGEALVYLDRMQSAAARMSILIKDLLNFSRIANQQDKRTPVSLEQVVKDVLSDIDLLRRIFQLFQRLHGQHVYGGTGIGLAICAKVVVDHGGAITARSQRGRALRLSSTYPLKQEVHSISLE